MGTMDRAYRFSSTPIDPIGLPDEEAAWAWKVIGFSKYPIGGMHFRSNGFSWIRVTRRMRILGSSIRRAYPFQQVAHERETPPISWLLVDTHA